MSEPKQFDVGLEALGLLTVPQVAERLAVSEKIVRRLIRIGELVSVKIGSRLIGRDGIS